MLFYILLAIVLGLLLGLLLGNRLTWWYIDREYRKNPYRIKAIVEQVIARREGKGN